MPLILIDSPLILEDHIIYIGPVGPLGALSVGDDLRLVSAICLQSEGVHCDFRSEMFEFSGSEHYACSCYDAFCDEKWPSFLLLVVPDLTDRTLIGRSGTPDLN